ncbi:hypothetical protein QVN91_03290 [Bacteroides caecigallinarum]|uniref:Uncharacterized protein n=1 Tax=Candidatus Phocaeicola faecigallinarum TaxID=2838732 RepID=A0A948WWW9_9BACT|nr:hypothetical protein [Candidatus Phocaeicola faecigallinarum]MDN0052004.1 hypothetical protein [Bacteroides caecigallinarum]
MMDEEITEFKVQKTAYYNDNGLFIEEYQIFMNNRPGIMCGRDDFERLYKIMGKALNDRKENNYGKA